ncbi:MMPL family transporter [Enhygromyxa salina]|uniref:Membrane transport protein mmpL8 n=1 Tax=Enhygromyxa salina TaxID=215803 RepID=A0A2S9YPP4_9BACT|nr:MMPL family transporter [Enhygromyxa salina]PRQ07057.1 Membrane transport protein mmpL8 [Enhygromyxa salina]
MSQRDRLDRRRDKFFVVFGRLGLRWPVTVTVVLALLTVVGMVFASQLTIKTSRVGLVDGDNWYQRRIVNFYQEFGHHDSPVAIIAGGTPEQRRAVVDGFAGALEQDEMFHGRVLARLEAKDVAETLLVHAPGQLAEFRRRLPADADLPGALERGLEGMLGLVETQLLAALDGEIEVDRNDADAQLGQLAALATALDAKLAGDAGVGPGVDTDALLRTIAGGDAATSAFPDTEELRKRGLDEHGYFVSNDGERLLVVAFPEFAGDEVADFSPAVERLRAQALAHGTSEVSITLTGVPFLVVDEEAALASGMVRASAAAGIGIFLLLLIGFRSFKRATVALLPIGVGTLVSLGAMYLLFDTLDPITSSFAAVLMGLGIDFSVHLLARYDEDLRQGRTRREALFSSLSKAGPGVVTGAVTTALAFLTVATTEFTSYGRMGVITAIGLVVALVATLLLLPVVLGRGDLSAHEDPPRPFGDISFLARMARSSPLLIVLGGLVLSLLGIAATPTYNPGFLEFLPKSWESTQGLQTLEKDGAMTPWFAWVTADDLDQARRRADSLRSMQSVARVDSPTDMLPELTDDRLAGLRADFAGLERNPDWRKLASRERDPAALAKQVLAIVDALDELVFAAEQAGLDSTASAPILQTKQAFTQLKERLDTLPRAQASATLDEIEDQMAALLGPAWTTARAVAERGVWVPGDLPKLFALRFVARDGSERISLYVYPAGDIASGADHNAPARHFTEDLESVDPQAAGQGVSLYHHNVMIVDGFKRAAFFSLCLVVVLLLLDFANLRKSLLALFPVLVGMGWMVGGFAIVGLRLNVATIVVLPLTLGIGIDAGVHMMHRWELNARTHGGRARLDEVIRGTGNAVVLSSLTTMVGFAGLLLGRHLGMVQLGATMVIGIGCTLVASVLMLPALLLLLDKAE